MTAAVRLAGPLLVLAAAVAWGQDPAAKKDAKPAETPAAKPAGAKWRILFRSDDPTFWDKDVKNGKGEQISVPLSAAAEDIRYLRLRRMDTGEAQIILISQSRLKNDKHGEGSADFWWNGSAKEEWKGRHLGIAQTPRLKFPSPNGQIHVMNEGWDGYLGSGFGHKSGANDKQRYCWKGKEIVKTEFEVAVSAGPLGPDEAADLTLFGKP